MISNLERWLNSLKMESGHFLICLLTWNKNLFASPIKIFSWGTTEWINDSSHTRLFSEKKLNYNSFKKITEFIKYHIQTSYKHNQSPTFLDKLWIVGHKWKNESFWKISRFYYAHSSWIQFVVFVELMYPSSMKIFIEKICKYKMFVKIILQGPKMVTALQKYIIGTVLFQALGLFGYYFYIYVEL